jgi:NADPH:quinone reductase
MNREHGFVWLEPGEPLISSIPQRSSMRAVVIEQFGGPEVLQVQDVSDPELGPSDLMIAVEAAGVGQWDPFEREGGYARMLGLEAHFPYILGSEGSGVVLKVGEQVTRFRRGDRVYAVGFLNPKGGFYAERVVVPEEMAAHVPPDMPLEHAGVVAGVGLTALRGLEDVLELREGESVLILGASGGIGHIAVQIAKLKGARVLAIASGADGVQFVNGLGADLSGDGHREDILSLSRRLDPEGLDAALLTVGGDAAERAIGGVRDGGRIAYPNGVTPVAEPARVTTTGYNGEPDGEIMSRLSKLVDQGSVRPHVAAVFPMNEVAAAHRMLAQHYPGKIVLRVSASNRSSA